MGTSFTIWATLYIQLQKCHSFYSHETQTLMFLLITGEISEGDFCQRGHCL